MPSSVLTSDSMHIGLLAAAAHAAATNSCFTVFYNPRCNQSSISCLYLSCHSAYLFIMSRASKSDFVIPLSKYIKATYQTRISVGMRFRMLFETEESSVRRQVYQLIISRYIIYMPCNHVLIFTLSALT